MTAADPSIDLEEVPCPLCGTWGGAWWATEHGFVALRCVECGLIYVSPRPVGDRIDDAARTGMHRTDDGELEVTDRFRWVRVLRRRRQLRSLWPDLVRRQAPVRWLDVGAGHGELLLALRAELPSGSTVQGVEPNLAKVRSIRQHGVEAVTSLDAVEHVFDVVSLMNVFSHLPDPVGFLRSLGERLVPGGNLVLETGNAAELVTRDDYPDELSLPDHLTFAGEPQLRQSLQEAGFLVLAIERRRVDGVAHLAKSTARRVAGHPARIGLPYRSPFRFLYANSRRT